MILQRGEELGTLNVQPADENDDRDSAVPFDGDAVEFDHEIFKTMKLGEVA